MFNEISAARDFGVVVRIAALQTGNVIRYDVVSDAISDDNVTNLITGFERTAKEKLNTLPNADVKWAVFGYMRVFMSPINNRTSEVWLDLTDTPKFMTQAEHDALLDAIPYNAILFDTYKEEEIEQ